MFRLQQNALRLKQFVRERDLSARTPENPIDEDAKAKYIAITKAVDPAVGEIVEHMISHIRFISYDEIMHRLDVVCEKLAAHKRATGCTYCIILPVMSLAHLHKSNVWFTLLAAQRVPFEYAAAISGYGEVPTCPDDMDAVRDIGGSDPACEFLLFDDVMYSGMQLETHVTSLRFLFKYEFTYKDAPHPEPNVYACPCFVHHKSQIDKVTHPALHELLNSDNLPLAKEVVEAAFPDVALDVSGTLTYLEIKTPDSASFEACLTEGRSPFHMFPGAKTGQQRERWEQLKGGDNLRFLPVGLGTYKSMLAELVASAPTLFCGIKLLTRKGVEKGTVLCALTDVSGELSLTQIQEILKANSIRVPREFTQVRIPCTTPSCALIRRVLKTYKAVNSQPYMQHMYACITQPTSVTVLKEVLPPSCTSLQSYMAAGMSDDVFSAVLKRVVAIWEDLFKRGCLHPAFTDNIFMNTSGDMIITSGECIDRHSHGMDELVSLRDVLVITPLRAAYRRHHTTSTSQSPVATTCGEGSTSSRCTCVFIPDVSRSALITGGRRAGRGGHGIVLIGRPSPQLSAAMPHLPPTVAIKQQLRFRSDLRPDGFTAAELFELLIETEVMRAVNDMDGVVKLHGCVTTNAPSGNQFLFIIMEDLSAFYSLVDLAEKGTRPPTKAQLADVVRVVRPIVKELHRRNIAHGDLWKPNVMVRRTALRHAEPLTTNDVRVIDFGESCWFLEPARGRYCDDYKGKIGYEHGVHLTGTALKDYLYARDNDMLEKIYSDAEDSTSTE